MSAKIIKPSQVTAHTVDTKAMSGADALLRKLRKRLVVPRNGSPYIMLAGTLPYGRQVPLSLVKALARFKVLGKTIMVQTEVRTPVTEAKMTLQEAVQKIRSELGRQVRIGEVMSLINSKAEITSKVWHPATPAELEEFKKARRNLDRALLEAAASIYKRSMADFHKEGVRLRAQERATANAAETAAENVALVEGMLKEYK